MVARVGRFFIRRVERRGQDGDARGKRSLEWASHQRNNLLQLANSTLDGIHYMPMKNTQDLLQLLMQDTEARQ